MILNQEIVTRSAHVLHNCDDFHANYEMYEKNER